LGFWPLFCKGQASKNNSSQALPGVCSKTAVIMPIFFAQ
jgi:hypothetical protein